jgi:hypothetical protein
MWFNERNKRKDKEVVWMQIVWWVCCAVWTWQG